MGFRKLKDQYLESTATATALEEHLRSLREDHTQLVAKGQDMERQIRLAEQLSQASEARAQVAERKAGEAEIRLGGFEHQVRDAETRFEESERRFHNVEQQATDAAALASRNVRLLSVVSRFLSHPLSPSC